MEGTGKRYNNEIIQIRTKIKIKMLPNKLFIQKPQTPETLSSIFFLNIKEPGAKVSMEAVLLAVNSHLPTSTIL